jgi:MFS superfamily sulfate permease-like transporter
MQKPLQKFLLKLLPILGWLPRYNRSWALGDLLAGLTVGIMVVPQSLAYAKIIGLPLQHGLYSSFVGVLIYMFFATSKDVTIGNREFFLTLRTFCCGNVANGPNGCILLSNCP